MDNSFFDRTLTALDHARLQGILSRDQDLPPAAANALAELLDAAEIVSSETLPNDIATMRSQVRLCNAHTGQDFEVLLRYPHGEVAEDGGGSGASVNVLTPLGLALLGSKVGDDLVWSGAGGAPTGAKFKAMVYQPEAAGDWLD